LSPTRAKLVTRIGTKGAATVERDGALEGAPDDRAGVAAPPQAATITVSRATSVALGSRGVMIQD
jgi:hypothetical protein